MAFMPSRFASGAYTSSVSRAFFCALEVFTYRQVRALCTRSASLTTSTRTSRLIATTILRMVSACAESPYSILESLVTPSTRPVTVSPNSARHSSSV